MIGAENPLSTSNAAVVPFRLVNLKIGLSREFVELRIRRRDLEPGPGAGARQRAVVDGEPRRKPAERMQFDVAEQGAQLRGIAGSVCNIPRTSS